MVFKYLVFVLIFVKPFYLTALALRWVNFFERLNNGIKIEARC